MAMKASGVKNQCASWRNIWLVNSVILRRRINGGERKIGIGKAMAIISVAKRRAAASALEISWRHGKIIMQPARHMAGSVMAAGEMAAA